MKNSSILMKLLWLYLGVIVLVCLASCSTSSSTSSYEVDSNGYMHRVRTPQCIQNW